MYLRRRESVWFASAPAKLNLYLNVTGVRNDGYHELETFMVPIALFDSLSLVATQPAHSDGGTPIELTIHEPMSGSDRAGNSRRSLPTDSSNLVVRALQLLRLKAGCDWGARDQQMKHVACFAPGI